MSSECGCVDGRSMYVGARMRRGVVGEPFMRTGRRSAVPGVY